MANPQCWAKFNNTVTRSIWKPCGSTNATTPFVPCCEVGDSCMTNGICRYSQSQLGGSGFYAGGCTDTTFGAKQCPQLCNGLGLRDVVFDNRAKRWACCGTVNGTRSCEHPTKESFDAPRPNDLQAYFTAGDRQQPHSENRVSISSPPITSATAQPSSNSSPKSSHRSRLSGTATGLIGAAVAVGVLVLVGILVFICLRKRNKKPKEVGFQSQSQPLNSSPAMATTDSRPWTAIEHPPPTYPSTMSTPVTTSEQFQQHYQPPQSSIILEATPMEMGSNGKLGGGHPLTEQSRAGLPMRHELPTDNEIRPVGTMSPLSPTAVQDLPPIKPLNYRKANN